MEHIMQFAVNIDDEKIKQVILEKAETQILSQMKKDIERTLFDKRGYYHRECPLEAMVKDSVNELVNDNKDFVLDKTAQYLAEKLANRKATKQMVEKVVNGMAGEVDEG